MNHYAARQQQSTLLWHYTCANGDNIYPVGNCGRYRLCAACDGRCSDCLACQGNGVVLAPTVERCPGHVTAEEACEHYRQGLLDEALFSKKSIEEAWPQRKCEADCDRVATHVARTPGRHYARHEFCEAHCTREELSRLVTVGECWSS